MVNKNTQMNLAVYMERLDSYISSQNALNEKLTLNLEKVETKVDNISEWRSKMYGVKTALVGVGFLVVHLAVIVGTLTSVSWINTK